MNEDQKEMVKRDPGHPVFPDYADSLRQEGRINDALNVCFAGLSVNPSSAKGRLVLARIFYERGYVPFAVRELEQLDRQLPENKSIKRLLEKFGVRPSEAAAGEPTPGEAPVGEVTVAESEFDIDDMDLIDK